MITRSEITRRITEALNNTSFDDVTFVAAEYPGYPGKIALIVQDHESPTQVAYSVNVISG